jgi:uncharacterized membrane protein
MAWNRRYSSISYVKSSLWVVPILALLVEFVLKRLAEHFGVWMVSQGYYDLQTGFFAVNAMEAHAILDRIYTFSVSCLVFSFGSLLVAIQVASGQYTPRIIATTLLRDNVIRLIVGLFVFAMLWSYRTMVQLGKAPEVPQFQVFLATVFGIASLIAFIILIDYSAKLLRPISLVRRVCEQGIAVIESAYPNPTDNVPAQAVHASKPKWRLLSLGGANKENKVTSVTAVTKRGPPDHVIYHTGRSAIVLAVNLPGLVKEARRADCVIEFAAQVGDFLSTDDPLFYIYGNGGVVDDRLREFVALGSERTMEQDPMFAFRIEVDIALKALSAAINDPTTAVLAIDQLQRLLRMVGKRTLRDREILDTAGQSRVVFRTPNWEDFVHISFREIRYYGAGSLQIARRLRAMVETLVTVLPEHRHQALHIELELLDRAIEREHVFAEDIALARIADTQGLGGASGAEVRS